jgi:hypothetical protein
MDLSTVVDVLSVVAVVSGLLFATLELRQFRLSRERESALELFKTFQTQGFIKGIQVIVKLPDNLSKAKVEELIGEEIDDLNFVLANLEGLGALVCKKELSIGMVEDFFSGFIVLVWKKLARYIQDERMELGRDTWAEWVQWLAERVMEREGKEGLVPAYIEHKDWKPDN